MVLLISSRVFFLHSGIFECLSSGSFPRLFFLLHPFPLWFRLDFLTVMLCCRVCPRPLLPTDYEEPPLARATFVSLFESIRVLFRILFYTSRPLFLRGFFPFSAPHRFRSHLKPLQWERVAVPVQISWRTESPLWPLCHQTVYPWMDFFCQSSLSFFFRDFTCKKEPFVLRRDACKIFFLLIPPFSSDDSEKFLFSQPVPPTKCGDRSVPPLPSRNSFSSKIPWPATA